VVYLHGNCGSRVDGIPVALNLSSSGMSTCIFDSSGAGNSEGKFVTLGIKE